MNVEMRLPAKQPLSERMRPETGAGGFSHLDGTVQFYGRINALMKPDMVVMDLGAGRGAFLEDKCTYRRGLQLLKGKVREVIGVDVDPAVKENPALDRSYVISETDPLPVPDESIDVIISDWVFEHVSEPGKFSAEIERVLKRRGWVCARTNNKWGMIGLAARIVPNRLHTWVLEWLQPDRKEDDVFPVLYRMNTKGSISALFPLSRWLNCTYSWNGDPAYHAENRILWRLTEILFCFLPSVFATSYFIFIQKKP